jgi:RNA polymerase sigma factor (sigma-70 family)
MEERQKLKLTDRSGKPFAEEHLAVLDEMREALWRPYSQVRNEADRVKVMGDTLERVQRWEPNQNRLIDDLPSAIRLSFHRAVLNFLREDYYRVELEVVEQSKWEAVPQDTELDSLVQILMKELLKSLSTREKQVVSLTRQKFKAKDVAKRLGISEANVYQINHRIRERVKEIL